MNLKYVNCVIFVRDIDRSRQFYTEIMRQKVIQDYGRYVGFESGFGIWEYEYAMSIIYPETRKTPSADSTQVELYFESDQLDLSIRALKANGVVFIHDLYEHEWGQRGIRIQDPDGVLIEISEPIVAVIRRFLNQGLSVETVSEKTGMPISEIESYC